MTAVHVDQLRHSFGKRTALDGVSLRVAQGSLFGLLGPNGGGKTTLLRILATLLSADSGTAYVDGLDVSSDPQTVRRRLGIVFQSPALDDELSLEENLRTHAALYELSRSHVTERLSILLPMFGLSDRKKDRLSTFSGGLKRRADIVRGLIHTPPILLLDEPTTGLDPAARQVFWEILGRLRQKERTTIVVATHIMEEADRCDRLAIIDRGSLVAEGSPDELKRAIGEEMLWLESDEPPELLRQIHAKFDIDARLTGSRIRISSPDAHELLGTLYTSFTPLIRSATVRRPALEDVFMVHAGRRLDEADDGNDSDESNDDDGNEGNDGNDGSDGSDGSDGKHTTTPDTRSLSL